MKKFVCFMIMFFVVWLSFPSQSASASEFYWAKVEMDNVCFYAQAESSSALFILPRTYFVKLTDEKDGFYKAQYKDLIGYVKKEEVSPVSGTPSSPYFVETFRVFLPSGAGLYASAKMESDSQILTIPYLYEDLVFYGSIEGDVAVPEKSNLWHYCKYENSDFGYVYSAFTDKLSSPPLNYEEFEKIEVSFAKTPVSSLSDTAMAFIIIGVALPCLIVLYLLVKPNLAKALPREKAKYKAKRRRDYFEFDEADLN